MQEVTTHIDPETGQPSNELLIEDDPLQEGADDNDEDLGGASTEEHTWAVRNGWVPRDQFRGTDDDWVNAKTFADRGRGINALLKRRNSELERSIDEMRQSFQQFAASANARVKNELDVRLAAASERRRVAVANGDTDAFDAAERDVGVIKSELDAMQAAPAPKQPVKEDPAGAEWYTRNQWFRIDIKKTRVWLALGLEVRNQRADLIGNNYAFLAEVDKRAVAEYPEMFGEQQMQPRRQAAASTRGPAAPRRAPGEKTFDDLPKEAQGECDEMIRRGYLKKREDYVSNYDWNAPR